MSNTLSQRIREAREDSKMSQLQVAVALGVSDKTISGYESGRISPPINKLQRLSDLLKKPIGFFVGVDPKNYKVASRLRAIEVALRDIRQELREIKLLAQKENLD
jgi:transcriptional regulator with XRE-family HTH domain